MPLGGSEGLSTSRWAAAGWIVGRGLRRTLLATQVVGSRTRLPSKADLFAFGPVKVRVYTAMFAPTVCPLPLSTKRSAPVGGVGTR